jgi:tRNA U34 5-methylaminomethyl-2-thiouridine-forming methyltransferase MnmC
MGDDQSAAIRWSEADVPISEKFDDPYFSHDGGLAEANHVFLGGNDLPARFCHGFQIAELGFGTGLNLIAAHQLWRQSGQTGVLHFTSFEAYPLNSADAARALAAFPEAADLAPDIAAMFAQGDTGFKTPHLSFELIIGDARQTLPNWSAQADAWFLDGFSPAKNPELWGPDLMMDVGRHTRPKGTFSTYTAAGFVRRSLGDAGFHVARVPGYGRKRHMSIGHLT